MVFLGRAECHIVSKEMEEQHGQSPMACSSPRCRRSRGPSFAQGMPAGRKRRATAARMLTSGCVGAHLMPAAQGRQLCSLSACPQEEFTLVILDIVSKMGVEALIIAHSVSHGTAGSCEVQ